MRISSLFAAAFLIGATTGAASAQMPPRCAEGRMADGICFNPTFAQDMRTTAVVLSQPKLSMTNPPVLPGQDGQYDIPRDHHEVSNLHGYPPVTSANGSTVTFNNTCPCAGPTTTTVNTGPRS